MWKSFAASCTRSWSRCIHRRVRNGFIRASTRSPHGSGRQSCGPLRPNNTIWGDRGARAPKGVNLGGVITGAVDTTPVNSAQHFNQLLEPQSTINARALSTQLAPPQRPAFQLEGVYLKGQGVVYTTTLPHHGKVTLPDHGKVVEDPHSIPGKLVAAATCTKCHADSFTRLVEESIRTSEKMPSLWEQTRREMRGVKDEQKPPVPKKKELEVCGPGTVGEAVLKALAENGHHFSHLAE